MYLDLARELKKTVEHENNVYTNYNRCYWLSHQRNIKEAGRFVNKRRGGHHPNNYSIEIGHNTVKSHGKLRRLGVTQTSEKDHWLTVK